ncbi:MAG: hypothetical protein ACK52V_04410 [Betaproteobacteria bacterium]
MNEKNVTKSPVFPAGKQWEVRKRPGVYESDVTAMIRGMLQNESIREDQRNAWERWRNDPEGLRR